MTNKEPRKLIDKTIDEFGFVEMDDVSRLMTELKLFKRDIKLQNFEEDAAPPVESSTTQLDGDKQLEDEVQQFIIDCSAGEDAATTADDEIFVSTDIIREFFLPGSSTNSVDRTSKMSMWRRVV